MNVWDTLVGSSETPHPRQDLLYWHGMDGFQAIRTARWKLFVDRSGAKLTTDGSGPALFDLASDLAETKDVSAEHPEIVQQLQTLAERRLAEIHTNVIPLEK